MVTVFCMCLALTFGFNAIGVFLVLNWCDCRHGTTAVLRLEKIVSRDPLASRFLLPCTVVFTISLISRKNALERGTEGYG